jgi:hypothetical protein
MITNIHTVLEKFGFVKQPHVITWNGTPAKETILIDVLREHGWVMTKVNSETDFCYEETWDNGDGNMEPGGCPWMIRFDGSGNIDLFNGRNFTGEFIFHGISKLLAV